MNCHKPNETKNKNFEPVSVSFLFQIKCPRFNCNDHSDYKENSPKTVKVNKRKPTVEKRNHL